MTRILIVEDHKEVREAVEYLIKKETDYRVIGSYEKGMEALDRLSVLKPQIMLVDLGLPDMSGIDLISFVKENNPDIEILVLTVFDDNENVFRSIKAGARGYILKDNIFEDLLPAVEDLIAGGAPLSPKISRKVIEEFNKQAKVNSTSSEYDLTDREQEILNLVAKGDNYTDIAEHLGISFNTVKTHMKNIFRKLEVKSKVQAIRKFSSME